MELAGRGGTHLQSPGNSELAKEGLFLQSYFARLASQPPDQKRLKNVETIVEKEGAQPVGVTSVWV